MASPPPNLFVFDAAPEHAPEFDISDPELLRMLESSQRSHFWFRARNRQILDFLAEDGVRPPARILEVGCGSGTVLSALADAGYRMTGVEMHRELALRAAHACPTARIFSANVFSPPSALLEEGPFDAVGFFDVLEHLAKPEAVLRACAPLLEPGGRLLGTLPALSALWSDYDRFAGHQLRYDRREVDALFTRAAISAPRSAYFFQALLPGMLVRRALVGRGRGSGTDGRRAAQHRALDPPGAPWSALFAGACAAERVIRRALPAPMAALPGTSLWFSSAIPDPGAFKAETRATAHTDGKR
jgi:SAM-dependent methyltransferase